MPTYLYECVCGQAYDVSQDGKGSKFWVQCPTSDAGSDWYRRKAGIDSTTGILTIELDKHVPFSGTVTKH